MKIKPVWRCLTTDGSFWIARVSAQRTIAVQRLRHGLVEGRCKGRRNVYGKSMNAVARQLVGYVNNVAPSHIG